jgi:hypothetical protein
MKNTVKFLAFLLLVINFNSCESDDSDDINFDDGTSSEINLEDIHGKWMVSNSTIYKSFEFTDKGVCIMVEKSMAKSMAKSTDGEKVSLGTYAWDNFTLGLEFLLEDGKQNLILDEIFLTKKSASFTVTNTATPNNVVPVQSVRAEEMEESVRTELLAKSWIVVSMTVTDEEGIPWTFQLEEENIRMIFSLTYYGTFSSYGSQNGEVETPYGTWIWSDKTETAIRVYSNKEFSGYAPIYTIDSLTENSLVLSLTTEEGRASFNCIIEPSGRFW